MAQSQDLMGLGESSQIAVRVANNVAVNITATGTTVGSATQIPATQFVTVVSTFNTATNGVVLPVVGGASGCLLGDVFTIHNGFSTTSTSMTVYCPVNANGNTSQINVNGATGNTVTVAQYKTLTAWPVYNTSTSAIVSGVLYATNAATNTTLWIGLLA